MDKSTVKKSEGKYVEAVGRRKTSVARVRATAAAKGSVSVNGGKSIADYFKVEAQQLKALESLAKSGKGNDLAITAVITGGGINSQAEALRHAIARVLTMIDPALRKDLKKEGYLKRDARAKERRKFGLKKARKAPQWSKR
ncbi:MAG: 30S ribosomal protein S9 [Patescibacteria group bacterium]|nr:30S ribosomal protein S9 [Patescibacteria group bacterium]MDE1945914.1 30S ribosomal protein S9 [Patescibacteria group bacterium]